LATSAKKPACCAAAPLTHHSRLQTIDLPGRGQAHSAAVFAWLGGLSALTALCLELRIDGFPNSVCQLDNLRVLELKHLSNVEVPATLAQLQQLTSLTLADCGLCCVPAAACCLTGAC